MSKLKGNKLKKNIIIFLFIISFKINFSQTKKDNTMLKCIIINNEQVKIKNITIIFKFKNNRESNINLNQNNEIASILIPDTTLLESISLFSLGYEVKSIQKRELILMLNSLKPYHIISLTISSINLNEITIKSESEKPFYQNEGYLVLDYTVTQQNNIILVTPTKILLIDQEDHVIKSINNDRHIDHIIQDCLGKIYFQSKNKLYCCNSNNSNFLIENNPINDANAYEKITEFIACNKSVKIKEVVSDFNQKICYQLQLVAKPKVKGNLYVTTDIEQFKIAAEDKQTIDNENVPERMGDINYTQNKLIKNNMQKIWNFEYFTTQKIIAPLFIFKDTIYVFDYNLKKIITLNYTITDTSLRFNELRIDTLFYDIKKEWKPIIIMDNYTGYFYTLFQKEKLEFIRIDINNRIISNFSALPKGHIYIDNVKIFNNNIYYLWNDKYNPKSNKTLYKSKLN